MKHGVKSGWLVQPPLHTVSVFTASMDSTTQDRGTVTDLVVESKSTSSRYFLPRNRTGTPL